LIFEINPYYHKN